MRTARLWRLIPALALGAVPAAGGQSPGLVLTRLELDLRVDYDRRAIDGTAILQVRNRSDHAVAAVPLLSNRLMNVSQVLGAAGASVPFEQRVALFEDDSSRQVNAIAVTPPHPIAPGDSLRITVHYGGVLVGYTETGSRYIQDHVSRDFTIIREDAYAFPTLGVPSRRINRTITREPFSFAARVTVPAGLVVAMGGEPGERVAHDTVTTWSYSSAVPVPFLNITIAPYQVLERRSARIYYFPADSDGARMVERAIAGAMERLGAWYGPLGRDARLVVMEIPEGFGSQASLAAGILQTADAFRDRAQLPQLYHELSHLWNAPDVGGPSPRWNEGLASFLQWRLAADLDGWNDWDARIERTVQSLKSRCGSPPSCDALPFAAFGEADVTDRSYPLGLLMFYALDRVLGRETFDRAYRDFFQRYRVQGATSRDLAAAFHRASRKSDVIFTEWFFGSRWYERLAAGEPLRRIVDGYR